MQRKFLPSNTFYVRGFYTMLFLMSIFLLVSVGTVSAQVEILGPIDTGSQGGGSNDDDGDSVNLSKSKYTPTDLNASARSENQIQLTWTDHAKKEDGYDIQRRSSNSGWRTVARIGKNTSRYVDNTVVSGTTYTYHVAAFDSKRQTDWSHEVTVKTPGLTPTAKAQVAQETALKEQKETLQKEFNTILVQKVEEETDKVRQELRPVSPTTCTLAQVPPHDIDKAFRERCEQLTGQKISDKTTASAPVSFWDAFVHNTRMRLLIIVGILFILLNNVMWHITHKTVKKRLKGEF